MSAPTPAPGDESPSEGYYPDPSIPGYVRYWNGASWVPGTSRPAPQHGETPPGPPAGTGGDARPLPAGRRPDPAPVDETGPMYFDEAGAIDDASGSRQEPAATWQADSSRQTGFGGDRDLRVSWGGEGAADPRTPAGSAPAAGEPADRVPEDPRRPAPPDPTAGALPGMRDAGSGDRAGDAPPSDGTVTIRALGRGGARPPRPRDAGTAPAQDGTMAIRATPPGDGRRTRTPEPDQQQANAQSNAQPNQQPAHQQPNQQQANQQPAHQQSNPPQAQRPALSTPVTPGPGGGSASWAQQVHQLAQPEPQQQQPQQFQQSQQLQQPRSQQQRPGPRQPQYQQQPPVPAQQQAGAPDQPVVPWKPPVDDHFQQLARAQASARPAGLGKRFAARMIDTVVLGALVGAAGFPLVTRAMDHIDEKITAAKQSGETVTVWLVDSTTAGLFGGVIGAFLVIGFVLEALPTAKWGRTLGKKLCGLDVRDLESHGPPTIGAALRRWLVYGVLGILVIGVANVLWCLIDRPWRQCWHDKAARTFVAG